MAALKTVVFMGSARNTPTPWGGAKRAGTPVLKFVQNELGRRAVKHEVTVLDPVELKLPLLETPHFFYKPGEAPEPLDKLAQIIREADCYVVVTAEYNHSIPPALKNMLDYFGGSNYAFKPSGIVSYSTGQWGGMRAAMSLRPILSELGCLPVSNLFGIPHVGSMFDEEGVPTEAGKSMPAMLDRMLNQLEWVAIAFKNHRQISPVPK